MYSNGLANYQSGATWAAFTNSCTSPTQTIWIAGDGNITNPPSFANDSYGDYRLAANSPCINAGTNLGWMTAFPYDIEGRLRIRYGAVDMGVYEFINRGAIFGLY